MIELYHIQEGVFEVFGPESMDRTKEEFHYAIGMTPPRYPMPSRLGPVSIYPQYVCINLADHDAFTPILTAWNESYGLPLPEDHCVPQWHDAQWEADQWKKFDDARGVS